MDGSRGSSVSDGRRVKLKRLQVSFLPLLSLQGGASAFADSAEGFEDDALHRRETLADGLMCS